MDFSFNVFGCINTQPNANIFNLWPLPLKTEFSIQLKTAYIMCELWILFFCIINWAHLAIVEIFGKNWEIFFIINAVESRESNEFILSDFLLWLCSELSSAELHIPCSLFQYPAIGFGILDSWNWNKKWKTLTSVYCTLNTLQYHRHSKWCPSLFY